MTLALKAQDKATIIKQVPLFSELSRPAQKLIEDNSYAVEYKKDQIVYREGDAPDAFYCMITGRAQVFVRTPSGDEKFLVYLHRGDYVGIISLLTGEPHSVTVRIINDSFVLKIDKSNFDYLLKEIPQLAFHLSQSLSRRLKRKDLGPKGIFESTIISVYGVAKGVGRTMYAADLAISLVCETHKKVILLDMSPTGNEIVQMLRIENRPPPIGLKTLAFDYERVKPLVIKDDACGIFLLNIAHVPEEPSDTTQIIPLLSYLASEFHYIVVDLPLEMDKTVYAALTQSDLIHLVTDCTEHNLKATGRLIDELSKTIKTPERKIKAIINEFHPDKTSEEHIKILGHKAYATLPDLGLLAGIMSAGLPPILAVPDCLYSKAIRRIAREIGGVLVGLALSSGAALGLAHIGVIKVLEREKIPIDFIAGSSVGALIGAFWASGIDGDALEKIALEFKKKFALLNLADFSAFPLFGFLRGVNLTKFIRNVLGRKTFRDTHIPIKITACKLRARELVVLDEGSLVDAVRASCSIPALLEPYRKQEDYLIDGGILDPVPVDVLLKLGARRIIAVNCLPSPEEVMRTFKELEEKRRKEEMELAERSIYARMVFKIREKMRRAFLPNIFDVIMNSMQSMEYVLAEASAQGADCVLHPTIPTANWFELYKVAHLIKRGEEEAQRMLPQIKALIAE